MRRAHYWVPTGPAAPPSEIVVVDTESWRNRQILPNGDELHTLDIGCAMAYRIEKERRTRAAELTFRKPEQFWEFLEGRLNPRRPVWVFGHNLGWDMGILKAWQWLRRGDIEVSRMVVDGQLFFMKAHVKGCTLWFNDTFNYCRMSLKKIGKALGFPKDEIPLDSRKDHQWEEYCRRDVEVTAKCVDTLIQFARTHDLGPWQPTLAALAFSSYRHRFMSHNVLVHTYTEPLQMERRGYYGGLVDTQYIGSVQDGEIHEYDVNSMYPWACLENLPTTIAQSFGSVGRQRLDWLLRNYMAVADVTLRSERDRYPCRDGASVVHPTGTYRTVLPDAELRYAHEAGHIVTVNSITIYNSAPIFEEYMMYFHGVKQEYDKSGDDAFRFVAKIMMNSLYGKTGQQSPRWQPWNRRSLHMLERHHGLKPDTLAQYVNCPPIMTKPEDVYCFLNERITVNVRQYWDDIELNVGDHESRDSCPAIAACVTSIARRRLRELQNIPGHRNWYYSDTDSLWVNDTGRRRLEQSGVVDQDKLGALKYEKTHQRLTIYGPKDYVSDVVRKRKGVRPDVEPNGNNEYIQLHFPSVKSQLTVGYTEGCVLKLVKKHLYRDITACNVGPSGWTSPLQFPQQRKSENP